MGNDGGTIAKGQDLRAIYAGGSETQDRLDSNDVSLFNTCALSALPLYSDGIAEPVVGDSQGRLYLKEKVLENLLQSRKGGESRLKHIRGLDDIVTLTIKRNAKGQIVCPVSGVETSGKSTFCYLRPCGCVFAYKLIVDLRKHFRIRDDEPDIKRSECPACAKEFVFNFDIVILNPEKSEGSARFNDRNIAYLEKQGLSHSKRQRKKKRKERKTDNQKSEKESVVL